MAYSPRFAVLAAAMTALVVASCRQEPAAPPAKPTTIALIATDAVSIDPSDEQWRRAPAFDAELILQDAVDPRLMDPSVSQVRVQAMADDARLALRLQWDDETADDVNDPGNFADACAIQLPTIVGPEVPSPQMGEPDRQVEIAFWSAAWQAVVDGRKDDLEALHPNATVDHYPFEAASLPPDSPAQKAMEARYAPARALGNAMAGPRTSPVQDLVSEGPGTLTPAPTSDSDGLGRRTEGGWEVVITRPLPQSFSQDAACQIAFAVWEGSRAESGSRKMRSVWIPLKWQEEE